MITIIEDTRQQSGKHELKHQQFDTAGVRVMRCKLPFGDYALPPAVAVDTKKGLEEVAKDIVNEHKRFRAECINAYNAGTKLIILIEEESGISSIEEVARWINPELQYRQTAVTGSRLAKSMATMRERYGVEFEFCHPADAAATILKLLGGRNE